MLRKAAWQEDVAVPGTPALKFSSLLHSEASPDPSLFRLHEKNIGFRFRFTVEYYGESLDSVEKTGSTRLCPNSEQYQDRLASHAETLVALGSRIQVCNILRRSDLRQGRFSRLHRRERIETRFLASGQLIA